MSIISIIKSIEKRIKTENISVEQGVDEITNLLQLNMDMKKLFEERAENDAQREDISDTDTSLNI